MAKILITLFGKTARVDADQADLHAKKQKLVAGAANLNKIIQEAASVGEVQRANAELNKTVAKIIRLNRRIRANVEFINE